MYVSINRILIGLGLLAVSALVVACHIGQSTPTMIPPSLEPFVAQSSFEPDAEIVTSQPPVDTLAPGDSQLPPARERLSQLENQYIYYIASLDASQEGQSQLGIWRASLDNKERILLYSRAITDHFTIDGGIPPYRVRMFF